MRKNRNKEAEHEDNHRWIVSYADFITLLFAFFVVMYAISSVNVAKYKALADGMNSAFSSNKEQKGPGKVLESKGSKSIADVKGNEKDPFDALDKSLSELVDDDYHVNTQDGWIELDIKAGALFDSGSADLKPSAILKLMKLADIIKKLPYPIALEGYTDNVPISTSQFPSNWELSSARAAALARSLTIYGVDPGKITVTGYGEQYPVATNDTEEGRAKNRRVNLLILKDKTVPRLLNPEVSTDGGKVQATNDQAKDDVNKTSQIEPIYKDKL